MQEKQLQKLLKIITYYRQQLEFARRQLQSQTKKVHQQKLEMKNLDSQMEQTQRRFDQQQQTPFAYQLVNHVVNSLHQQKLEKADHLVVMENELEECRNRLLQQMAKLESMEKLWQKKADEIATQRQRREQVLADERYLNKLISGSVK